jgi:hypothetical protein
VDRPNGTAPEEWAAIKNILRRKTMAKMNLSKVSYTSVIIGQTYVGRTVAVTKAFFLRSEPPRVAYTLLET